ncbi:MAG TPA: tRNA (adenosine(37)-N6)-threonylcarbamoyltransferase complex ATPase subunit type 1 TsaE [Candidatus Acidoferrales bacterium]|nr:tRNA (adenosine(37)-N6)-threonylcarbamoyltransferase complex ATPase subunit type 1 TsaE [Candidatus Acidoferrales bacterium]
MPSREWTTHSSNETIQLGREIGRKLTPPTLILLSGDLGAGKTTLTKGIASGMGAAGEDEVTSPTFTLVHKYDGRSRVYHVDLYRIEGSHDLETLGLEDLFNEPAVVIVEWPEKLTLRTDWPVVRVHLEHVSEDTRRVSISAWNVAHAKPPTDP